MGSFVVAINLGAIISDREEREIKTESVGVFVRNTADKQVVATTLAPCNGVVFADFSEERNSSFPI